jgi:tripartite ATP-independent transporter DctP family solute receptor
MKQPLSLPRRRLLSAAAIAALPAMTAVLAPAVARAAPSATAPAVLRLGIGLPADSVQGRAVLDFAQRVARYTDGALRIELHAGGKLGNDLTMVQSLRDGTLEMTAPDSSTLARLNAGFSAINYPFTFFDEAEADTILDGAWGQRQLDGLVPHGLIGLAFWENGFRHITNSLRPMAQAKDFNGVRLRTMQNDMLVDSFQRLGFEAVPMPFPQVYEALRSKAVDGQENPLPTILASRFHEVQKYLTLSRHVYSVHVLLMSRRVWESLAEPQRAALRRAAAESRDLERRWSRDAAGQALTALRERGMEVSSIPRQDAERIRHRLRDVFDKYNRQIGAAEVVELYVELGRLRTAGR